MLLARRRFRKRQEGVDVSSPSRPAPRTSAGSSAADRRRRRAEARRRRYEEYKRKREEARRRRAEERRRRREEYKRKLAERRRKREEARRRRAEERRRKIEEYKAKQRRKKAEKTAKKVLSGRSDKLDATTMAVLVGWADQAEQKGDTARALAIWQRLNALRPGVSSTLQTLARLATKAGKHGVAAAALKELYQKNRSNLALLHKLRAAQKRAGLTRTPLPLALLVPKDVLAMHQALKAGQTARAVRLANARLQRNASDPYAQIVKADVLLRQRKIRRALALARKVAAAKPTLAGPPRIIGGYHLKVRDRSAALREFKAHLRKLPKDPSELPWRVYVKAMVQRLSD
jgi:hypothetical protein